MACVTIEILGRVVGIEGRILDFYPPYQQLGFNSVDEIEPYLREHFWSETVYRIIRNSI